MSSQEGSAAGDKADAGGPTASPPFPETLTKRADFLRAARARRVVTPGFILQARRRAPEEPGNIRVGYTCSKKVGNAVRRNHAKRRLREIARLLLPSLGQDGWDYVLIGRPETTGSRSFEDLRDDLRKALAKIHGDRA